MGQLERKKKQRAPRGSVERSVLETLATIGDMLTIVLVKRSATLLVRRAMKETTSKPEQRVRETISRLKPKVEYVQGSDVCCNNWSSFSYKKVFGCTRMTVKR